MADLRVDRQILYGTIRGSVPEECRIPGFDPDIDYMCSTVYGLVHNDVWYPVIPDWDSTRLMTRYEQAYFPILTTNDIEQAKGQSSLRVQPNPAREKVNVTSEEGIRHLEVIDMNGRTLIRRTVRAKTDRTAAIEKLVVE